MNAKVLYMFACALENKRFIKEMKEADNLIISGCDNSNMDMHLLTVLYQGWLVGKYKKEWKKHI